MPHWLNSKKMRSLMFILVYGLGYAMIAVISVTVITSVTGYWPNLLCFRKRHHQRFALIKTVPITPPIIPSPTNGTSSKNIHGLLYSTKNMTEWSLPKGLMDRKIKAAIRAQKNDRHRVLSGK